VRKCVDETRSSYVRTQGDGSINYNRCQHFGRSLIRLNSDADVINLLRLEQRGAAWVVTDSPVRDMAALRTYRSGVFAVWETSMTMPMYMQPYEGERGSLVRQCTGHTGGFLITADDGGAVVVPRQLA
jgi:hypothetical protein